MVALVNRVYASREQYVISSREDDSEGADGKFSSVEGRAVWSFGTRMQQSKQSEAISLGPEWSKTCSCEYPCTMQLYFLLNDAY